MPWIEARSGCRYWHLLLVAGFTAAAIPAGHAQADTVGSRQFAVVIDAAHGGPDTGVHLSEKLEEKDLVLDLAVQLRSTLSAHGIPVTTTREMDINLPAMRRAEVANHREAAACLVLHATASGHGVHLYTSSLAPPQLPGESSTARMVPWDSAQAGYVQSSLRLSSEINSALTHAQVPVSLGRTSLLPLDNLTCPAVAVEIAPLGKAGEQPTPLTDTAYQKQLISALVAAIEEWRHDWAPPS